MVPIIFATIFTLLIMSNANADQKHGFTVDMIHRDSPKSPFYNPAENSYVRMRNTIYRSGRSALQVSDVSGKSIESEITSSDGNYLINISIGTPAFPIIGYADTGSDLIWTQCHPCENCFEQTAPMFDPKDSSTYKKVPWSSRICRGEDAFCSKENNTSSYMIKYADGSESKGDIAVETVTFSSTNGGLVSIRNVTIGCGHNNSGNFPPDDSGVIGFGRGPLSLISQLGDSINGKFSYCLVPFISETSDLTSKINFGENAVVSGDGVVSIPMIKKHRSNFYHLTLEAISVGSNKIQFPSFAGTAEGNIIINTGTTVTRLPSEFYLKLESAVVATIKQKRVQDPRGFLSLCYSKISDSEIPDITLNFKGGDVKLDKLTTFVAMAEDLHCFSFRPSDHSRQISIYGNLAQVNYLIGYDRISETVSFKKTNCANI